jgi:hypothetical protein
MRVSAFVAFLAASHVADARVTKDKATKGRLRRRHEAHEDVNWKTFVFFVNARKRLRGFPGSEPRSAL